MRRNLTVAAVAACVLGWVWSVSFVGHLIISAALYSWWSFPLFATITLLSAAAWVAVFLGIAWLIEGRE